MIDDVAKLSQAASKLPYYKFNNMWSRQMQSAVRHEIPYSDHVTHNWQVEGLLFWGWLGGYKYDGGEIKAGRLLTIEELGEILKSMHVMSG